MSAWTLAPSTPAFAEQPPESVAYLCDGPFKTLLYLPQRTAMRIVKSYGEWGHCECSHCGCRIDVGDLYCRRCGSYLIETKYEEVGK